MMSALQQHLPGWGTTMALGNDDGANIPFSHLALRDWILEEYERTGLTRRLSELDLQVTVYSSDPGSLTIRMWQRHSIESPLTALPRLCCLRLGSPPPHPADLL